MAALKAREGEDIVVLNNTEYVDFRGIAAALEKLLESFSGYSVMVEPSIFIGRKHIEANKLPFFQEFFLPCFAGHGMKIRPDLVVVDGVDIDIYDWKTTKEKTLKAFTWQARNLDYLMSLYYYALGVEMATGMEVRSVNIVPLPKSGQSSATVLALSKNDLVNELKLDFQKMLSKSCLSLDRKNQTQLQGFCEFNFKDILASF